MEKSKKKVFVTKELQEELGLSKNYITVTEKQKKDTVGIKARSEEAKQRRSEKKKLQKIREKKAKEKKLRDIMESLEQNTVPDTNIYDLLTSATTLKKDKQKYEMTKQKLGLSDTKDDIREKEKQQKKLSKKAERLKQDEEVNSRIRLLSEDSASGLKPQLKQAETVIKSDGPLLEIPDKDELYVPVPLEYDPDASLNELWASLELDDEESLADKNSNKNLMKVNLLDKKPALNELNRTEEMDKER